MIKAICFDLDWVYFTNEWKESFYKYLLETTWDKSKVDNFLYSNTVTRELYLWKVSSKKFLISMEDFLWKKINIKELSSIRCEYYKINKKVKNTISLLRSKWYIICSCTNNNLIRINGLESKFWFKKDFDFIISSHEIGIFKPDKRIFQSLIDKTKLKADQIIYTDDKLSKLSWAKELWIHTYLYDNIEWYITHLNSKWISLWE